MKESTALKFSKFFKSLGNIWIALAGIFIFLSAISILLSADSLREGWSELVVIFNPWNLWNFLAIILIISPGLGAHKLSDYFEKKSQLNNTEYDS